ncbi:BlaI/MecI/CopY family transcriptional regulator [Parasphingopyxis lamellibrachiae]|uniref:Putative transcriptional regulator n=1 Tax=Parasphingopyxis lamellibrachiae TaxID=680125 RepID=A0A3D9FE77_9SPHN|nr:BlaI/MecI/CopY family transcriptional regulator [Parasphingopyxis lamellibrachiae]RED15968.1 putative transcriptional regulator [Parasphingopyxis lamellibrachiae]
MADKNSPPPAPSEAEAEILQIVWECQPVSVRTVHEQIRQIRDVGYTTVLKQLQRMLDKGLVDRIHGKGKSFDYIATQPASETRTTLLNRLVRTVFGNSTNDLVMHALGRDDVSPSEIEQLKAFIAELEAEKGDSEDVD